MEAAIPPPVVLIVDDDKGLARLIQRAVRREGISTALAYSGEEALAWLADHSADLMLLDLKLPDFQGAELINRLADISRAVPFIIITGQGDERVAVDMMKRGALDYLLKDVQFLEFVPIVVQRALTQLERERNLKAAEEAFLKEHVFGNAVLAASGAIMIVLDREGRIVRSNPACELITGYSFEELQGKPFRDFISSPHGGDWELADQSSFEKLSHAPSKPQESFVVAKNGETRLISWSITAMFDPKAQAEFVIASGMDITEHRRLEREILEISDHEQRRIGQDLHDGLGQEITAIALLNSSLHARLKTQGLPEAATAGRLAELIKNVGIEVRKISHGLQPVSADPESLSYALRELVASMALADGAECVFDCEETVSVFNPESANHLYRIAQEAMQNALRHGRPKTLIVSLQRRAQRVLLEVRDDGAGIDPQKMSTRGIGLSTMRYRAESIGGSLDLIRPKEGGTLVRCTAPDSQLEPQKGKGTRSAKSAKAP